MITHYIQIISKNLSEIVDGGKFEELSEFKYKITNKGLSFIYDLTKNVILKEDIKTVEGLKIYWMSYNVGGKKELTAHKKLMGRTIRELRKQED